MVPSHQNPLVQKLAGSTSAEGVLITDYRTAARALRKQGRFTEAKTAWIRALNLLSEPANNSDLSARRQQWCDCANDLAWFLVTAPDPAAHDLTLAMSLTRKTTELHPQCSTYWNTQGFVYYRTGYFKQAVAALERSITLTSAGTAFDHFCLAMAFKRLDNQEQAARSFATAKLLMEAHQPNHAELIRLRDEATSLVFAVSDTAEERV
jgi:tetratricopeptide (TPR) repeat protein